MKYLNKIGVVQKSTKEDNDRFLADVEIYKIKIANFNSNKQQIKQENKMTLQQLKDKTLQDMKEHYKIHSDRGEPLWFLKQDAKAIKRMEK